MGFVQFGKRAGSDSSFLLLKYPRPFDPKLNIAGEITSERVLITLSEPRPLAVTAPSNMAYSGETQQKSERRTKMG